MLSDTTQSDLEQLLAEQDNGWCAYQDFPNGGVAVSFGIGGCLVEQMHRLLDQQQLSHAEMEDRRDAMMMALGFTENMLLFGGHAYSVLRPSHSAMYTWNDRQRDPDVIRHRIKDALNGEYSHAQ